MTTPAPQRQRRRQLGKMAQLPKIVRVMAAELLAGGKPPGQVARALNELPCVRNVLGRRFPKHPQLDSDSVSAWWKNNPTERTHPRAQSATEIRLREAASAAQAAPGLRSMLAGIDKKLAEKGVTP